MARRKATRKPRSGRQLQLGPPTPEAAKKAAEARMRECEKAIAPDFAPPKEYEHKREELWRFLSGAMHASKERTCPRHWRALRKRIKSEPPRGWYRVDEPVSSEPYRLNELYGRVRTAQNEAMIDAQSRAIIARADRVKPTKRQLERLRAKIRAEYATLSSQERREFRRQPVYEPEIEVVGGIAQRSWLMSELLDGIDQRKRRRAEFNSPTEILMDYFVESLGLPVRSAAILTRDVLLWFVGRIKKTCQPRNIAERYRWLQEDARRVPGQP